MGLKISVNYMLNFPVAEDVMPYGGAFVPEESKSICKKNG